MFPHNEQNKALEKVVDRLIEQTESNALRWQPVDILGGYVANIGPNSVTITGVAEPSGQAGVLPAIVLRDAAGTARAKAGGFEEMLGSVSALAQPVSRAKLRKLADLVRTQAGGVDPIVFDVLRALGGDED